MVGHDPLVLAVGVIAAFGAVVFRTHAIADAREVLAALQLFRRRRGRARAWTSDAVLTPKMSMMRKRAKAVCMASLVKVD